MKKTVKKYLLRNSDNQIVKCLGNYLIFLSSECLQTYACQAKNSVESDYQNGVTCCNTKCKEGTEVVSKVLPSVELN